MAAINYKLNGVQNYSDPQISKSIEWSLYRFFDYGFLNIGALVNIQFPISGVNNFPSGIGGHSAPGYTLRRVDDVRYAAGRVWEGFRNNWVHENLTGVPIEPIQFSGIYINNVFYPTGTTGPYAYKVNYPEGRIIFDSPIQLNSSIRCEYAYKLVKFDFTDQQWFKHVQFDSQNADNKPFAVSSGFLLVNPQNKIQLPAVIIGSAPNVMLRPYEMGNLSRIHNQDVDFHILAETDFDRKQIHDIIINQFQKSVYTLNYKNMSASGVFPLGRDGDINPSGLNYKQLMESDAFLGPKMYLENIRSREIASSPPLFRAVVRATITIEGI